MPNNDLYVKISGDASDFIKACKSAKKEVVDYRGGVASLSKIVAGLRGEYAKLSSEEQKGAKGKDLQNKIAALTSKMREYKGYLGDTSKETKSFTQTIVASAAKFVSFTAAIEVAKKALDFYKTSIKNSQGANDAFVMAQAELNAVVEGFGSVLTGVRFDSFVNGMNDIVSTARQAAIELDRLSSMQIFNVGSSAKYQRDRARLREIIRTSSNKNDVATATAQLKVLDERQRSNQMQLANQDKAVYASLLRSALTSKGATGISNSTIDKYINMYLEDFNKYDNVSAKLRKYNAAIRADTEVNPYTGDLMYGKTATRLRNSTDYKMLTAISEVSDEKLKAAKEHQANAYNIETQVIQERTADEVAANRALKRTSGGTTAVSTGGGSMNLGAVSGLGYNFEAIEALQGEIAPLNVGFTDIVDNFNDFIDNMNIERLNKMSSAFEYYGEILGGVADAANALGDSMAAQMVQFGLNTSQILLNAARTISAMNAEALAKGASSAFSLPFPANLAAWATVATTIGSIFSSLPKFATGGIVNGSSTGDKNLIGVNGGEAVLTRADQSKLFSMLRGGSTGAVQFVIHGNDLRGVLNNQTKKLGRL